MNLKNVYILMVGFFSITARDFFTHLLYIIIIESAYVRMKIEQLKDLLYTIVYVLQTAVINRRNARTTHQ